MRWTNQILSQPLDVEGLHIRVFNPKKADKYIVYIHGGPGSHGEYFFQSLHQLESYQNLEVGWIVYDQRGCGRSQAKQDQTAITHTDNVCDLFKLVTHLHQQNISIGAILGHSYGAWILYDMLIANPEMDIKPIFCAKAPSHSLPRHRSILMDLMLLKLFQPEDYHRIYPEISGVDQPMWAHAKRVRKALTETSMRNHFYWANAHAKNQYLNIQQTVALKDNEDTFAQVMRSQHEIYKDPNSGMDPLQHIRSPFLWINGYHDFLMGGELDHNPKQYPITKFWHSAHYPHLEEPVRFCAELAQFLDMDKVVVACLRAEG